MPTFGGMSEVWLFMFPAIVALTLFLFRFGAVVKGWLAGTPYPDGWKLLRVLAVLIVFADLSMGGMWCPRVPGNDARQSFARIVSCRDDYIRGHSFPRHHWRFPDDVDGTITVVLAGENRFDDNDPGGIAVSSLRSFRRPNEVEDHVTGRTSVLLAAPLLPPNRATDYVWIAYDYESATFRESLLRTLGVAREPTSEAQR